MSEQEMGTVEVLVTPEGVKLRILSYPSEECVGNITLDPETGRTLAQRITLATIRHEEMFGE